MKAHNILHASALDRLRLLGQSLPVGSIANLDKWHAGLPAIVICTRAEQEFVAALAACREPFGALNVQLIGALTLGKASSSDLRSIAAGCTAASRATRPLWAAHEALLAIIPQAWFEETPGKTASTGQYDVALLSRLGRTLTSTAIWLDRVCGVLERNGEKPTASERTKRWRIRNDANLQVTMVDVHKDEVAALYDFGLIMTPEPSPEEVAAAMQVLVTAALSVIRGVEKPVDLREPMARLDMIAHLNERLLSVSKVERK